MSAQTKVAVVGGGPWGQALARAATRAGSDVTLVSRREQPAIDGVKQQSELRSAAEARLLVLAVPAGSATEVLTELGDHLDGGHFVLHGVRGLVGDELLTLSALVRSLTPARRVGALGGPVLVNELDAGTPSVMVVGSHFREVLAAAREAFEHRNLRLYMTRDLVGVEWASALAAALAIAIGFAVASGLGPGVVAAFTTRAVHEAARLATAAGADHATLLGLAGLGDLLAAINQPGRPEVALGTLLGQGVSVDQARAQLGLRLEVLDLLPRLVQWADRHNVRAPITRAIVDGLLGGRPRDELIHRLMTEPQAQGDRDPRGL